MNLAVYPELAPPHTGGVTILPDDPAQHRLVLDKFDELALRPYLAPSGPGHAFGLAAEAAQSLVDEGDTLWLIASEVASSPAAIAATSFFQIASERLRRSTFSSPRRV